MATSNLTLRSLTPTCLCYATSLCVAMLHDFPYAVTVGLLGVRVFFSAVMCSSVPLAILLPAHLCIVLLFVCAYLVLFPVIVFINHQLQMKMCLYG